MRVPAGALSSGVLKISQPVVRQSDARGGRARPGSVGTPSTLAVDGRPGLVRRLLSSLLRAMSLRCQA
jgi:hypothetical protein